LRSELHWADIPGFLGSWGMGMGSIRSWSLSPPLLQLQNALKPTSCWQWQAAAINIKSAYLTEIWQMPDSQGRGTQVACCYWFCCCRCCCCRPAKSAKSLVTKATQASVRNAFWISQFEIACIRFGLWHHRIALGQPGVEQVWNILLILHIHVPPAGLVTRATHSRYSSGVPNSRYMCT